MRKTCFKCLVEQSLEDFYRHPRMPDGHLNKCKGCTKRDVSLNRRSKLQQYSEYERERFQQPKRKSNVVRYTRNFRRRHPIKARAWNAVARAKRSGRLVPQPCIYCNTTNSIEAHHEDYTKPLDVRWVCFSCHREQEHSQTIISSTQESFG